jgi:hypothetical protein
VVAEVMPNYTVLDMAGTSVNLYPEIENLKKQNADLLRMIAELQQRVHKLEEFAEETKIVNWGR